MRVSRHALAIVLAFGAVVAAAASGAKDEIRIGQTLPYSGPVSGFGIIGRRRKPISRKSTPRAASMAAR
jgi:branched-chain amino acid transport system substrate-binding protein